MNIIGLLIATGALIIGAAGWYGKQLDKKEAAQKKTPARMENAAAPEQPEERLDDVSFIQEMRHTEAGPWQQYDILLAAMGYGWSTMVNWAQYMADGDLKPLGTLTASPMMHVPETEFIDQYREHGEKIADIPDLAEDEWGTLAAGGSSKALQGAPVKIVWFNQTRILRIFSLTRDESLMMRYAETVIRRSFDTEDAMKLARAPESAPAAGGGDGAKE